jgi:hypothetical protein
LVFTIFSLAQAEEVTLGPASLYLDMIFVPEPYWDPEYAHADVHYLWNGPINCTVNHSNIGHYPYVQIQLHQLEKPTELDLNTIREVAAESALLPAGWTTSASNMTIAGHEGIIINATSPDGRMVRVAGFSPDGDGGQGQCICMLRFDLGWSHTQALLESMRITISELGVQDAELPE